MQTTTEREQTINLLADKLGQLTPRTRISLLLRLGVPAEDVLGLQGCAEHTGWRTLPEASPLRFDGTVAWCRGCYKWVTS